MQQMGLHIISEKNVFAYDNGLKLLIQGFSNFSVYTHHFLYAGSRGGEQQFYILINEISRKNVQKRNGG